MKKSILQIQYNRLLSLYYKLNARLNRYFSSGRFHQFSKYQQYKLLKRIERIKGQLMRLEHSMQLAGVCLAISATCVSGEVQAQFTPVGNEFKVNTYTTNTQFVAAVATDADGDFVVSWDSFIQDGSGSGVYAQRYNASGVAQGSEFKVNTYTSANQSGSSLAMDDNGNFVVVWQSRNQDGDGEGVYAQRYNASGLPQGSEFRVNTFTSGDQYMTEVAMDADGDFVVTWSSEGQDGSDYGVYARRYNASGVPQGSEFLVNTSTLGRQQASSIAMDDNGDFVIAWESIVGGYYDIYAQRYNASGIAQGSEFRVNSYTVTSNQQRSSVAMDSDGDFVIAWQSDYQNGDFYGVYAQRYNASGLPQGSEFKVNTYTTDEQTYASVSMDAAGDFVIVWQSRDQDGSVYGIYGQRYNVSGVAQGSEFKINTYTTLSQLAPRIALDSDGDFVAVWHSDGQDGNNLGIYAQRFNGGFTTTPTAIQNAQEVLDVNLYPNPAKDEVYFNVEGEVNIKVFNFSGQVLQERVVKNQVFNLSGLKPGLYLVEIEKGGEKIKKKLVIE